MKFSAEFIESTREAQGDEAANQLVVANQETTHRELTSTAQTMKSKYPRVVRALSMNAYALPGNVDEAGLDAVLAAQEEQFTALGVATGEEPAPEPTAITPPPAPAVTVGTPPGAAPWVPSTPGIAPPDEAVLESNLRTLMDGEGVNGASGQADLARRRGLVAALEEANQQPNAVALVEGIRAEYEDMPMFFD